MQVFLEELSDLLRGAPGVRRGIELARGARPPARRRRPDRPRAERADRWGRPGSPTRRPRGCAGESPRAGSADRRPRATPSISHRSVAMNGICSSTWRRITSSRTSRPAAMLVASTRIASVAEERLGQREPAIGAVVERALEPLRGRACGRRWPGARSRTARARRCARRASGSACRPSRTSRSARTRTARAARPRAGAAGGRSPSCAADCARPLSASSTRLSVLRG